MNHLLLDLAKVRIKPRDIPFPRAKVGLFAPFKTAKRMITPEEPHSIYVLPEKRAAHSIITAVNEILAHHPDARIAIVSPRKKVQAALEGCQARYPNAVLLVKNRLGKSIKRFLKGKSSLHPAAAHRPDDSTAVPAEQDDDPMVRQAARIARQAVKQIMSEDAGTPPHKEPVFTLLQTQLCANDRDMAAALLLLKKNRPKKKQDLLRLLTQKTPTLKAEEIVHSLQQSKQIYIDAAENVRYR